MIYDDLDEVQLQSSSSLDDSLSDKPIEGGEEVNNLLSLTLKTIFIKYPIKCAHIYLSISLVQ